MVKKYGAKEITSVRITYDEDREEWVWIVLFVGGDVEGVARTAKKALKKARECIKDIA